MACSFHRPEESPSWQVEQLPATAPPDGLEPGRFHRLFSVEHRMPEQPYDRGWPTRFWARVSVPLPDDPLIHACALTYLSDVSTGVLPAEDGSAGPGSSIDHAVWFHRPVDMTDWTLTEYHPRIATGGRGWYTGSVFTADGTLVASLTQEALFRGGRPAWDRRPTTG